MKTLRYVLANLLAGFMDFGVGCLIAVLAALVLHQQLEWWKPIIAGSIFSVLPDYDIVPFILREAVTGARFNFDHHQSWAHWPAFMLPVVTIITWLLFGTYWGIVAFFCVLAHYVHDAVFMKNGILWLTRFTPSYDGDTHFVDHTVWLKNWLRPSPLSVSEITIGIMALGFAFGLIASR